jgi:hypothetical protein
MASNKGFGPRLKGSAQASKKGSAGMIIVEVAI